MISGSANINSTFAGHASSAPSSSSQLPKNLGVSVHYLATQFLAEVLATPGLSRTSTFYEIEDLSCDLPGVVRRKGLHMTCPIDGRKGASYVHCLFFNNTTAGDDANKEEPEDTVCPRNNDDCVGVATHMLSWTWG